MRDISLVYDSCFKYRKIFAAGFIFILITGLLQVFLPSYVGKGIDIIAGHGEFSKLYTICAIIIFIELFKGFARFMMRLLIISASWKIENDIRKSLFSHLLKLPAKFYNTSRTGDIIARITNDLTAVRMMVGPAAMYTTNALILVPIALAFMISIDMKLALFSVMPLPFIAVMMYFVGKSIHRNFVKVQESYSDISAHIQENLSGIQVIKAFVRENSESSRLKDLSIQYVDRNKKVIIIQSFMHPLLDVFASAGIIIVLWIGGKKVIAGETSIGVIVSLIMYLGLLIWPSIALGWVIAIFQRGMASAKRIQEIFDEIPEPEENMSEEFLINGEITIKGLSFAHNGGNETLKDISFEIKKGSTVAITGRTGSGKSTLLNILAGNYPIGRGNIGYNGRDINDISLGCLRKAIAFVPQETFLFSESIAENISFGREGAEKEEIEKAAVLASVADEIINFQNGYETVIGERGITLSGGQRQRIAIARALLTDAPVVFFDDCLSSVDTVTEKKILDNIKKTVKHKTAVIVTQRLGAVKDADLIIYMKDGMVSEKGTHDELIGIDGEYALLYKEQESIESIENGGI